MRQIGSTRTDVLYIEKVRTPLKFRCAILRTKQRLRYQPVKLHSSRQDEGLTAKQKHEANTRHYQIAFIELPLIKYQPAPTALYIEIDSY